MKQSRWSSPVIYLAIVAQVLTLLSITGVIEVSQVQAINIAFESIMQLLVCFGVLNSPTTKDGF